MPVSTTRARLVITSPLAQGLLLIAWGLLSGLAYPRPNLWLLAHFALAPLTLLALRGASTRWVLSMSYIAAVGWWCVMLMWLTQVTVAGYFMLGAYLAIYIPLYVALIRFISRKFSVPMVIAVPVVWVACEWVRGWLMTGFPWFLLGHSQPTAMIQIADLAGAYGVSFVVACTSGLLCDLLINPLVRPVAGRMRIGSTVLSSIVIWFMLLGCTLIYGAYRLVQFESMRAVAVDSDGTVLSVGIVQTDVAQSNKEAPTDEAEQAWFDGALQLTQSLFSSDEPSPDAGAVREPDLVIWPETIVPRAINDDALAMFEQLGRDDLAAYRQRIEQAAARHNTTMLVGASAALGWQSYQQDGQTFYRPTTRYNSAYLFDREGHLRGRYDKMHRVAFGEYIPFAGVPWVQNLLIKLTPYDYNYTLAAGKGIVVFDVQPKTTEGEPGSVRNPWRVATPICFEDVVSYVCRKMVYDASGAKRVDVLANLTNDGWYPGWAQGPQHEQIARFRCVENRVPMARSVNRGVSSFIDSCGRVTERVTVDGRTQMVRGAAVEALVPDARTTLFGRMGDAFATACGLLTGAGLLAGVAIRRRRKEQP